MNSQVSMEAPRLTVQRWSMAEGAASALLGDQALGALSYGVAPQGDDRVTQVASQVLSAEGPRLDVWRSSGPVEAGRTGAVRWWRDDQWLFGTLDLDEAQHDAGFAQLSHRAYHDIFQTLADSGRPHLLRIWNYLPRIHGDDAGLERYRQFNIGRQQAFLEVQRAAFDGAPAACALGTPGGPLSIRFLAGRTEPVAVENPRQVSAYRYPQDYGPRAPTFSRAALAELGGDQLALLISGTASIVGHSTQHLGDVREQTRETLRNLQSVIARAHTQCSARFDLRQLDCVVYVRHPADTAAVREELTLALGAASHSLRQAVFLQADICRRELLVEIEAHAVAPGALRP